MNTTCRLVISARSPFARRVRLALLRAGVPFELDVINVFEPPTWLFERNPLGLVPILRTPEGLELSDSATILEYVEERFPGTVWPRDPAQRLRVRQASTWIEGAMQAVVSRYLESLKNPADPAWLVEHQEAIERVLTTVDRALLREPNQAAWDLAVLLDYLDLRMPELAWAKRWPEFQGVLDWARGQAVFRETAPPA